MTSPEDKQRAEGLKALREASGMSQQELADKLGVARHTVWRWETTTDKNTRPKRKHMIAMAREYGLAADDFADRLMNQARKADLSALVASLRSGEGEEAHQKAATPSLNGNRFVTVAALPDGSAVVSDGPVKIEVPKGSSVRVGNVVVTA